MGTSRERRSGLEVATMKMIDGMVRALLGSVVALLVLLSMVVAVRGDGGAAPAASPKAPSPEFQRDILPVLERRCASCHNKEKHDGQLSLHDRAAIERGGESGRRIVNVSFEDNELWRRIAGQDVELRMPADGPPLDAEELATFDRWARAGAPWPTEQTQAVAEPVDSGWTLWLARFIPPWLDPFLGQTDRLRADYGSALYLVMAWLAIVLLAERLKASDQKAWPLVARVRTYATPSCYGLLVAGIAAWCVWLHVAKLQAREAELTTRIATLEHEMRKFTEPPGAFVDSLEPERPKHPLRLGGPYYRGNDERSPSLYNGGFYRTATMHLALCDGEDRRLVWGDTLPSQGVAIRLDIERAPMATPRLFTPAVMAKAFLSPCRSSIHTLGLADLVYPLETVEEGEHWVGRVPLKLPHPDASGDMLLKGELYLYNCVPEGDQILERPHFGIRYRIDVKEDVIQPGSDLWMGSLYRLGNIFYPPPDKILPSEWFDSREIPVIEGANSSDPSLLGVEEHQHKQ